MALRLLVAMTLIAAARYARALLKAVVRLSAHTGRGVALVMIYPANTALVMLALFVWAYVLSGTINLGLVAFISIVVAAVSAVIAGAAEALHPGIRSFFTQIAAAGLQEVMSRGRSGAALVALASLGILPALSYATWSLTHLEGDQAAREVAVVKILFVYYVAVALLSLPPLGLLLAHPYLDEGVRGKLLLLATASLAPLWVLALVSQSFEGAAIAQSITLVPPPFEVSITLRSYILPAAVLLLLVLPYVVGHHRRKNTELLNVTFKRDISTEFLRASQSSRDQRPDTLLNALRLELDAELAAVWRRLRLPREWTEHLVQPGPQRASPSLSSRSVARAVRRSLGDFLYELPLAEAEQWARPHGRLRRLREPVPLVLEGVREYVSAALTRLPVEGSQADEVITAPADEVRSILSGREGWYRAIEACRKAQVQAGLLLIDMLLDLPTIVRPLTLGRRFCRFCHWVLCKMLIKRLVLAAKNAQSPTEGSAMLRHIGGLPRTDPLWRYYFWVVEASTRVSAMDGAKSAAPTEKNGDGEVASDDLATFFKAAADEASAEEKAVRERKALTGAILLPLAVPVTMAPLGLLLQAAFGLR